MAAATLHRLMLAGEFVFYLLLGMLLVGKCGWSVGQAVGLAMILVVAGRTFVIGVTYLFSRAYATRTSEPHRIGAGRAVAMFLRELSAFFLLVSVFLILYLDLGAKVSLG